MPTVHKTVGVNSKAEDRHKLKTKAEHLHNSMALVVQTSK